MTPSIISADFRALEEQLALVEPSATGWHVDVMDGHYVPNLTIGPMIVDAVAKASRLPQDVHLMITNPDETWEWYAKAGATNIAFHAETSPDASGLVETLRGAGIGPGLAVNPDVPAGSIRELLPRLEHVIVMSVFPGFSGQKFISDALPKLETLRAWVDEDGLPTRLIVDGGVNQQTAPSCVDAGADVLVSASAIFGSDDPPAVAAKLRSIAERRV